MCPKEVNSAWRFPIPEFAIPYHPPGAQKRPGRQMLSRDKSPDLSIAKTGLPLSSYTNNMMSPTWSCQSRPGHQEKIKRRTVRLNSGLQGKTYEDRRRELNIFSLEGRRFMYDLVQTFKIIRGFDDVKFSTLFSLVGDNMQHLLQSLSDKCVT